MKTSFRYGAWPSDPEIIILVSSSLHAYFAESTAPLLCRKKKGRKQDNMEKVAHAFYDADASKTPDSTFLTKDTEIVKGYDFNHWLKVLLLALSGDHMTFFL